MVKLVKKPVPGRSNIALSNQVDVQNPPSANLHKKSIATILGTHLFCVSRLDEGHLEFSNSAI
jgi:hypothetical protein